MTGVNILALKAKATMFPEPLKSLILSEPDKMNDQDFIVKICTWLKLTEMGKRVGK